VQQQDHAKLAVISAKGALLQALTRCNILQGTLPCRQLAPFGKDTRKTMSGPVLKEKLVLAGAGALAGGADAAPPPKEDAKPLEPAHSQSAAQLPSPW
jgi:hypothetical protein